MEEEILKEIRGIKEVQEQTVKEIVGIKEVQGQTIEKIGRMQEEIVGIKDRQDRLEKKFDKLCEQRDADNDIIINILKGIEEYMHDKFESIDNQFRSLPCYKEINCQRNQSNMFNRVRRKFTYIFNR